MAATNIEESSCITGLVKNSIKHTCVIDNFSCLFIENARSTDAPHPWIVGDPFECSKDERIKFQINVCPKGNNKENKDYVSVFLDVQLKEVSAVLLGIKLCLLNDRKQKYSVEEKRVFTKSLFWGPDKFVKRSVLLDKSEGLLPDDKLTILCEVDLYSDQKLKSQLEKVFNLTRDVSLENLTSQAIAKNREMYRNLLESGDHSDVVLVLENGEELKAHKNILSAHSPVFQAMFEADMKEKTEGRVVIEDLSLDVAKELLKFIYSGKVNSLDSLAEKLLTAADKYGLGLLKQICGQYLTRQVSTANAARLFTLADGHSIPDLKSTCLEYIRKHSLDVMLTQDWSPVRKQVVEELRQLTLKETPKESEAKSDNAK